jgi:hypothetical protein
MVECVGKTSIEVGSVDGMVVAYPTELVCVSVGCNEAGEGVAGDGDGGCKGSVAGADSVVGSIPYVHGMGDVDILVAEGVFGGEVYGRSEGLT